MKAEERIGQVFGRLSVVAVVSKAAHGKTVLKCMCSCGKETQTTVQCLLRGWTKSCGCLRRGGGTGNRTHGMCSSITYVSWRSMVQRCTNRRNPRYHDYGGRWITVCDGWLKFENFYKDMGPRPSKDHSLDRKDNDGPYCKDNCRWATKKEQNNNQRNSRLVTHSGETRTVSQWAASVGMHTSVLVRRLNLGWTMDKALTEPVKKRRSRDTSG